jgi:tetratricopeptide (TPR) repeat protein
LKTWNLGAYICIGLAIGLVTIPIMVERTPGLKARWALAQAANAVDLGNGDAKKLLYEASKQFEAPKEELDYWHVRLKMALKSDSSSVIGILYEAASINMDFRFLSINIAYQEFERRGDFKNALDCLILWYKTDPGPNTITSLNQLAYTRALAKTDLDTALMEINQVLKESPGVWHFLDTRAWILFQSGKLEEALEDANKAVKLSVAELTELESSFWTTLSQWVNGGDRAPTAPDGWLTRQEVDPAVWSVAVVRYHRMKILEALGKSTEAEIDRSWLAARKISADDRLY